MRGRMLFALRGNSFVPMGHSFCPMKQFLLSEGTIRLLTETNPFIRGEDDSFCSWWGTISFIRGDSLVPQNDSFRPRRQILLPSERILMLCRRNSVVPGSLQAALQSYTAGRLKPCSKQYGMCLFPSLLLLFLSYLMKSLTMCTLRPFSHLKYNES